MEKANKCDLQSRKGKLLALSTFDSHPQYMNPIAFIFEENDKKVPKWLLKKI